MIYNIIGSGPGGVNAALTLLERGKQVRLFDVGVVEDDFPLPDKTFHELKSGLSDPFEFFLGSSIHAIVPPGSEKLLEYPPSRSYIFNSNHKLWNFAPSPFKPILSLAKGGLGVGWGANCSSYDENDLKSFPISWKDFSSTYGKVADRISISGPVNDDLSSYLSEIHPSQPPIELNGHDRSIYHKYNKRKNLIQKKYGIHMGRARMAVVTTHDHPKSCQYYDRCLLGCPVGAIYNPVDTLRDCQRYENFEYLPNHFVTYLGVKNDRICSIKYYDTVKKTFETIEANAVILAAGAIASGAIFLRTLQQHGKTERNLQRTKSILNTKVVRIPYIQLNMIGHPSNDDKNFQFNKLIIGCLLNNSGSYPRYVHGEILSLPALLYHPLIESLPFGSRLSKDIFFKVKPALGVVTYFFSDVHETGNGISLQSDPNSVTGDRVTITYSDSAEKQHIIDRVTRDTIRALLRMGCVVSRGQIDYGVPGSGIHYAGTIPMSRDWDRLCVDNDCRSYAYRNLWVVDGAAFPSLPSKPITYSLIANAIRVAEVLT